HDNSFDVPVLDAKCRQGSVVMLPPTFRMPTLATHHLLQMLDQSRKNDPVDSVSVGCHEGTGPGQERNRTVRAHSLTVTKIEDVPSRLAQRLSESTLLLCEFRSEIAIILQDHDIS